MESVGSKWQAKPAFQACQYHGPFWANIKPPLEVVVGDYEAQGDDPAEAMSRSDPAGMPAGKQETGGKPGREDGAACVPVTGLLRRGDFRRTERLGLAMTGRYVRRVPRVSTLDSRQQVDFTNKPAIFLQGKGRKEAQPAAMPTGVGRRHGVKDPLDYGKIYQKLVRTVVFFTIQRGVNVGLGRTFFYTANFIYK